MKNIQPLMATIAVGTALYIPYQVHLVQSQNLLLDSMLEYEYPHTKNGLLQSSYDGKIIELYTTSHRPEEKRQQYEDISNFFGCPVHVLTDVPFFSQGNIHSDAVPFVFHGWLRDLFLFSENNILANSRIILNRESTFKNKRNYTDQVRGSLDVLVQEGFEPQTTPFLFEGGQVLRADFYTLVPDFFSDPRNFMATSDGLSSFEVQRLYTHTIGEPLFVPTMIPGESKSYMSGHLDISVTIVNPNTVFVADPGLGEQIMRQVSPREFVLFKKRIAEKYESIIGDTATEVTLTQSQQGQEIFDAAAKYLSQYFTVKRMPFVMVHVGGEEDKYLTYNNVLLDASSGKGVIPSFGLTALDSYAYDMYHKEGYTSLLVLDSLEGAITHSGIHCDYLEKREPISLVNDQY